MNGSESILKVPDTSLFPDGSSLRIQNTIDQIAKSNDVQPKDFFRILYQIILGTSRGPKIGPFISDIGTKKVAKTISEYL